MNALAEWLECKIRKHKMKIEVMVRILVMPQKKKTKIMNGSEGFFSFQMFFHWFFRNGINPVCKPHIQVIGIYYITFWNQNRFKCPKNLSRDEFCTGFLFYRVLNGLIC